VVEAAAPVVEEPKQVKPKTRKTTAKKTKTEES